MCSASVPSRNAGNLAMGPVRQIGRGPDPTVLLDVLVCRRPYVTICSHQHMMPEIVADRRIWKHLGSISEAVSRDYYVTEGAQYEVRVRCRENHIYTPNQGGRPSARTCSYAIYTQFHNTPSDTTPGLKTIFLAWMGKLTRPEAGTYWEQDSIIEVSHFSTCVQTCLFSSCRRESLQ